jgi:thiol-disulfide isomerase/thioredoxin
MQAFFLRRRNLALALAAAAVVAVVAASLLALYGKTPAPRQAEAPRADLASLAFTDATGRVRSLAEFRGRAVLLNLWATWCVPCREEMPTLDRLQTKLGGPDFEVVAVSLDRGGPERPAAFLAEIGATHLALYLADLAEMRRTIGVFGLPATLFIDREGREVHRVVGPAEWDSADMIASIRERLDLPAETGSTRP